MRVLLLATYEMGHSPFGLASPAAWLKQAGHDAECVDLAKEPLPERQVRDANLIAFHLPMHTATRLALPVIERVKKLNPSARIVCYGLYAPLNAEMLKEMGVDAIAGGEFEPALLAFARGDSAPEISIERLKFITPDRSSLPNPSFYAQLRVGDERKSVAYTEASRGCKHLCRHCPVVPIYRGRFRVVDRDAVLADIRQQVENGARHVTFGDPDFLNGPRHAVAIVEALHAELPSITYDATIKIEHLLKHADLLSVLRTTGCLFVTSAVESVDDSVLLKIEKNHTRADFFKTVERMRNAELTLQPTFIAFTPWTTRESYLDLLNVLIELELQENVAPIQLALRLLITAGSRLLELEEIRRIARPFDPKLLIYPWKHSDPDMDALASDVFRAVHERQKRGETRPQIFNAIREIASGAPLDVPMISRAAIPYLEEPWYC